ncbi:hypothetical protein JKP88DRAFT_249486 [Tribonema minus]|uniref:Uncharacterized protein n=1 Tax=Tribonema minus TaxID=303371 RepID=A0A835YKY6_9STRA|nr:hypothetical protein JKP88DRAFT_249486 [Tribonema minus]
MAPSLEDAIASGDLRALNATLAKRRHANLNPLTTKVLLGAQKITVMGLACLGLQLEIVKRLVKVRLAALHAPAEGSGGETSRRRCQTLLDKDRDGLKSAFVYAMPKDKLFWTSVLGASGGKAQTLRHPGVDEDAAIMSVLQALHPLLKRGVDAGERPQLLEQKLLTQAIENRLLKTLSCLLQEFGMDSNIGYISVRNCKNTLLSALEFAIRRDHAEAEQKGARYRFQDSITR